MGSKFGLYSVAYAKASHEHLVVAKSLEDAILTARDRVTCCTAAPTQARLVAALDAIPMPGGRTLQDAADDAYELRTGAATAHPAQGPEAH